MDGHSGKPFRSESLEGAAGPVKGHNKPAAHEPTTLGGSGSGGTGWNVRELLARVDNDQEFLCELLRLFRQDFEADLQKAKTALAEGDLQDLMRAAHTMKGMLKNLSMTYAAETACALETAARQGKSKEAKALLPQLEKAIAELLPQVDAQLAEVQV